MFFRGETSDHFLFDAIYFLVTGLFSVDSLLGNVVPYWRNCMRVICCYNCVYQTLFIYLTCMVCKRTHFVKNKILSDSFLGT